jgi:hypothetical protein
LPDRNTNITIMFVGSNRMSSQGQKFHCCLD